MINAHTGQSVPADRLLQRGTLVPIDEGLYRHEQNSNSAIGIGTILSYWKAEPGEHIWAEAGDRAPQVGPESPASPKPSLH